MDICTESSPRERCPRFLSSTSRARFSPRNHGRFFVRPFGGVVIVGHAWVSTHKKLLQEHEIEPWLRDRLPLLYLDQTLVCIPGIGVSEQYAAKSGESGLDINWRRPKFEIDSTRPIPS